jgi:hypothetical protein
MLYDITTGGATFGSVKISSTNQQGGFESAGERTVIVGNTKKIGKKKSYGYGMASISEQAYLELLKKYQR